jgi:hypothetical protein
MPTVTIYDVYTAWLALESYPIVRLDMPLGLQAPRISKQSAHEGGKVHHYPKKTSLVYIFVRVSVEPTVIVRAEGLC